MKNTVYILHSAKLNRFYTGFSTNFELRMIFHEKSEMRKFTFKADDWEVYFKIECDSKAQGLSIEKHIKRMKSSQYIQNLKKYPDLVLRLQSKYK